jgi:hypothetical protein
MRNSKISRLRTAKLRTLAAAAVTAGTLAGSLALVPAAHAATYDGQSAFATGCANSGEIVRSADIYGAGGGYLGSVYLWYSTACATTWGEIYSANAYDPSNAWGSEVTLYRNSDGASEYNMFSFSGQHAAYTLMLNDNGVTSYATGDIDDGIRQWYGTTGSY